MRTWFRSRSESLMIAIVTAAVTAVLTASAPVLAGTALNADTLAGRPGVGCGASHAARAGVYVATCGSGDHKGFLPDDIIKRAPDSAKLGGLPSNRYYVNGTSSTAASITEHALTSTDAVAHCCASVRVKRANSYVFASSSSELYTKSAAHAEAHCYLSMRKFPDGEYQKFSQIAWAEFPAMISWDQELGLVGGFVAPSPGDFDVAVICGKDFGDINFFSGNIIAWTVPNSGPA
jgi:hypothetical protein